MRLRQGARHYVGLGCVEVTCAAPFLSRNPQTCGVNGALELVAAQSPPLHRRHDLTIGVRAGSPSSAVASAVRP